jgi:hypothetical protein
MGVAEENLIWKFFLDVRRIFDIGTGPLTGKLLSESRKDETKPRSCG